MLPIWLLIAQQAKSMADNQNRNIAEFNASQQFTPNANQPIQPIQSINPAMNANASNGLGNALSTFSSIYGNYLDDEEMKKRKLMGG